MPATSTSRSTCGRSTDLAVEVNPAVRPHADEYVLADGTRLILLAEGRVVNLVAAEGNPAAVMDLSFAAQALALAWLARGEAASAPACITCQRPSTPRSPASPWPRSARRSTS